MQKLMLNIPRIFKIYSRQMICAQSTHVRLKIKHGGAVMVTVIK